MQPAGAIDIVVQLQDDGENPTYDPDGSRLANIFNLAASYWEDVLPAQETFEIDIYWSASEFSDPDDEDTLARWYPQFGGDNNIYVNTDAAWYFDTSPFTNEDYDFSVQNRWMHKGEWVYGGGQWLFRDLDASDQTAWFGGIPPDFLEVGYRGRTTDTQLENQLDLLSTAIHELGHELGVNSSTGPWGGLASVGWLGGANAFFNEDPDEGHLLARTTLMCEGCGLKGTRRLPSAVDIMAAADAQGWTNIDLPRQDFLLSEGSWNTGFNWLGGSVPDAEDAAYVRNGADVTMSGNSEVDSLLVAGASSLSTGSHKLRVTEAVAVDAQLLEAPYARISVPTGGSFEASQLLLTGGRLRLDGGDADIAGTVSVQPNGDLLGVISGHGTLDAINLINDGSIRPNEGTLNLTVLGADLDGSDDKGLVDVTAGNFTSYGIEDFHSTMTVGPGRTADISNWTLASTGELRLEGGTLLPLPATLAGTVVRVEGAVHVEGTGTISAQTGFEDSADVQVEDSAKLRLTGETFYRGGSFTGSGMIVQTGDATVQEDTRIDVARFDWDGDSAASTTTVENGVTFLIDSASVSESGEEAFDGTINLPGGRLDVQTHLAIVGPGGTAGRLPRSWRMSGVLNLSQTNIVRPIVAGSRMVVGKSGLFDLFGAEVNVLSGLAHVTAPVTFESSATVDIAADSFLSLESDAPIIYQGGTFSGNGNLQQSSDAVFQNDTQIDVRIYDMDGSGQKPTLTIDPGVDVVINSRAISPGDDSGGPFGVGGSNSSNATLVVDGGTLDMRTHDFLFSPRGSVRVSRAWRMRGTLELNRAEGNAPVVTGTRLVVGETTSFLEPLARLVVNGGTATIDTDLIVEELAMVELGLGGTTAGQFDRLDVTGSAALGGALHVALESGFSPQVGDRFPILAAADGVTGTFATTVLPGGFDWDVQYQPNDVILEVLAELVGLEGDYNGNGRVEQADLDLVLLNWGSPTSPVPGDWVNDLPSGIIDQSELDGVLLNWGNTSMPAQAAAVPEPATVVLLIITAIGWSGSRMRRRFHAPLWILVACAFVGIPGQRTMAQLGNPIIVASTRSPAPSGDGVLLNLGAPVLNNRGQVGFWAGLSGEEEALIRGTGRAGTLVEIARTGLLPGSQFVELTDLGDRQRGPIINDEGDLAFEATAHVVRSRLASQRIYRGGSDSLTEIARQGLDAPGGGEFEHFGPLGLNDHGSVSFWASLTDGTARTEGVFKGGGETLVTIARAGTSLPGNPTHEALGMPAPINDNGQVAFLANSGVAPGPDEVDWTSDVYVGTGRANSLTRKDEDFYVDNGAPRINAAGEVAMEATRLEGFTVPGGVDFVPFRGIYRSASGEPIPVTIAEHGDAIPDGEAVFTEFYGNYAFNDRNTVAFRATLENDDGSSLGREGIFLGDGSSLTQVVRHDEPVPSPPSGLFLEFGALALNNHDQLAFSATILTRFRAMRRGIFLYDPTKGIVTVALEGMPLDGSTVEALDLATDELASEEGSGLNDRGQVAYLASLADGRQAIALISLGAPLPGDYNGNGRVEQADLDLVLLNWGEDADSVPGNWASGMIDQAELDGVLLNWGKRAAPGSAGGAAFASAAPEPAAWVILAILLATAVCGHRIGWDRRTRGEESSK